MNEILVGTIFMVKAMAFAPCVQLVDNVTSRYPHMTIQAEKNNVQVMIMPSDYYRFGFHCTNGELIVYRKSLTSS